MSFAKKLENILSTSDVKLIPINQLSEYEKGQLNMLNRVMIIVQQQLIKEITE